MEVNVPETVRVDGVVVQVNEQLDYAYVHTVGLGRALISPLLKIEDVKVGAWLSLTVTQNDNFAPQHEGSRCRYAAVGELRAIGEVIPTASKIAKSGVTVVRAQTEAFIGSVREHGAIALSQYLGRIFVGPKLYESVDLKAGMWVDLGVHSADASQANAFCFWEAKTIAVIENSAKLESNIRRCHGRFAGFLEKNVCLLELSGRDEGFVCVRPSDFISSIPPRKLREAKAIQVYANHAVSPLKSFPVPVCYARVLEGDELEMLTENEAHPNLVATNSRDHHIAAVKDAVVSGVTPDGASVQDEVQHDPNCSYAQLLHQLMKTGQVASVLRDHNRDLHERIVDFLKTIKCN